MDRAHGRRRRPGRNAVSPRDGPDLAPAQIGRTEEGPVLRGRRARASQAGAEADGC